MTESDGCYGFLISPVVLSTLIIQQLIPVHLREDEEKEEEEEEEKKEKEKEEEKEEE